MGIVEYETIETIQAPLDAMLCFYSKYYVSFSNFYEGVVIFMLHLVI